MNEKKSCRSKWKKLTPEQEKKIIEDFNAGLVRNKIMRGHKIPAGQLYYIIRETASNS